MFLHWPVACADIANFSWNLFFVKYIFFVSLKNILHYPIINFCHSLSNINSNVWQAYQFFSKRGIPTDPFEFFYGHFRIIRKKVSSLNKSIEFQVFKHQSSLVVFQQNSKSLSSCLVEWTQKFGKTFG